MGANLSRDVIVLLGLLSLSASFYFVSGFRTVLGSRTDLFENVAWGKFFAGAVYAGLSVLLFFLLARGVI
jgi:hypothetical protein